MTDAEGISLDDEQRVFQIYILRENEFRDGTVPQETPEVAENPFGTPCEAAEDCEGDDAICATMSILSVDEEHADYDANVYGYMDELLPVSVCST